MCQAGKAENGKGQSKFTLRESLLADILPAIETASTSNDFAQALEAELMSNADLRNKITDNRKNPLIAQRKILNSLPRKAQSTVSQFIKEILTAGNRR